MILNGEPLEEVDWFMYQGPQVAADGGCERDVVHRMNEGYRAWGAVKSVLSNRGLGIKAKKCLYEGVIVPTALYGAEAWGMRSAERRKVTYVGGSTFILWNQFMFHCIILIFIVNLLLIDIVIAL